MPTTERAELTIAYGWDAPLGYFYLTVQRGDDLLYSNCDDPDATSGTYGGGLTLHQLQARLGDHGLTLSPDDLDALAGTVRRASPRAPILTRLLRDLNGSERKS